MHWRQICQLLQPIDLTSVQNARCFGIAAMDDPVPHPRWRRDKSQGIGCLSEQGLRVAVEFVERNLDPLRQLRPSCAGAKFIEMRSLPD